MIYLNSDTTYHFNPGLSSSLTGEYVNDASITATLKDRDGIEIYSFDFEYVEGSDGDYLGSIPMIIGESLNCGEEYVIDILIIDGETTAGDRRYEIAGWRSTQ